MTASEIETVLEWHAALNSVDTDRLLALSTEDVEVGGPRGAGHGAEVLRDWVARAQIQLEPLRWQAQDGVVVAEQSARWQGPDGKLTEPQTAASVFRVQAGKVASVLRFGTMTEALEFAGLRPSPSA
jgi:ketosteroid isomerase-like protein